MRAESARKIESNLDRAASGLFAVAAGYAGFVLLTAALGIAERGAGAAAIAALAYVTIRRLLGAIEPEAPKLPVPVFDVREMEPIEPDELLLTDRYVEPGTFESDPLILDDVLGELAPDSRVVRLFNAAAMPTPGQLNDRIRQHLETGRTGSPSQDASQALHEALAELRRTLR